MSEVSQSWCDLSLTAQDNENYSYLRHTEEQYLQSAECWLKTQSVCKTFQPNVDTFNANIVIGKRKYPVTNTKELSCNKSSYLEKNNQLDCFGSKEPHNDDTNSVILSGAKDPLKADTNNAILRGLNSCSPQNDRKNICRLMRGEVYKSKYKVAFTLVEVLISLGIIGVVAALTLPSVIFNYKEKRTVTKLYSTYSLLSQAFENMVNDYGEIDTYSDDEKTRINTLFLRLQNYILITKACPHNVKGCLDSAPFSDWNYGFVLKNGASIRLINGGTCIQDTTLDRTGSWELNPNVNGVYYGTYHHSCGFMYVNIDGSKNAELGKNTFLFAVVKNGIVPVGGPKERTNYNNISKCLQGSDLSRCTAWVVYNKNMDYLRCPEQLGWNKASHCSINNK